MKGYRETGSLKPRRIGGYRPKKIVGADRDGLLSRCLDEDFTLNGLVTELAERGLDVDYRTVWNRAYPRDRLTLIDAKTGPRHVLLVEEARKLLGALAGLSSEECVFPGAGGEEPLNENALYYFWLKARDDAGIVADARLHDLRDSYALHAIMNGESLHMAGRLLGHRRATTTDRYAHLDDVTLSQAAERVAEAIKQNLILPSSGQPYQT